MCSKSEPRICVFGTPTLDYMQHVANVVEFSGLEPSVYVNMCGCLLLIYCFAINTVIWLIGKYMVLYDLIKNA